MVPFEAYEFTLFQRLVNSLILNSCFCDNLGLMHGKMGQAIFFSHLYRETKNSFYENISSRLIDEIYNGITITTNPNFEDGLAGVGWGIEYLVQKGFVNADTDEVLESIDQRISQIINSDLENIDLLTGYCGYGFYLLNRLRNVRQGRNKLVLSSLARCLKMVITKIEAVLKKVNYIFVEPEDFDLCWEPFILILFQIELSKITGFQEHANNLDKTIKTILDNINFKSDKTRLLTNFLLQFSIYPKSTYINNQLEEIFACFEMSSYKTFSIRHSFLGVYLLFRTFLQSTDDRIFSELVDSFLLKLINEHDLVTTAWNKSKCFGILEGFCGLGIIFLQPPLRKKISSSENWNDSLKMHPKSNKTSIKVLYFPLWYSGAGTYSEELISYLKENPEVELYIIEISSEISEYTITKTHEYINIQLPIDKKYYDNKQLYEMSDSLADYYFIRVAELLSRDVIIIQKTIFHFNHPTLYKRFLPIIRRKFNAVTILTYHFVSEHFIKYEFANKTMSVHKLQITNKKNFLYDNPNEFNAIICVSHFAEKVLRKYYNISQEKTRVIWNGTSFWKPNNLSKYQKSSIKEKIGLNSAKRIILYSGRLEPRKGIEELLEVFSKLCNHFNDLYLIVAGEGDFGYYLPMCRGFWEKVSFTGNLPKEMLQQIYYIADIGVVPSRWELFGYVLIEMMHSGLPVIATNVAGMNDILNQYTDPHEMIDVKLLDNRFIVDTFSLYETLKRFLENPSKLKLHADKGLKCAQKQFTRNKMGGDTLHYYKEIINVIKDK
jgi:glycosyltransferase involved in cell wall biosynthesis